MPAGCLIGVIGESGETLEQARCQGAHIAQLTGDALARGTKTAALLRERRHGGTLMVASEHEEHLASISDEMWWVREGKLALRGDPAEVLAAWRRFVSTELRRGFDRQDLAPSLRRGDGRARIEAIELFDAAGDAAETWRSGSEAAIAVTVRFESAVDDPVVGIMIRTRIGFEVYGTNTELERVKLGPCAAGDTRRVWFRFRCELCPQEYTVTAASHDPDGVWHDWLEDAVAFRVVDDRYTAGVANLRARVEASAT